MRSCIDMLCPSYNNFSIRVTLHHNGTTVHGQDIQRGLYNSAHSYDNINLKKQLLACSLTGTFFLQNN